MSLRQQTTRARAPKKDETQYETTWMFPSGVPSDGRNDSCPSRRAVVRIAAGHRRNVGGLRPGDECPDRRCGIAGAMLFRLRRGGQTGYESSMKVKGTHTRTIW